MLCAGIRCDKIITVINGGLIDDDTNSIYRSNACLLACLCMPMICRTVVSDVSSDLIIKINNITYHLHKVINDFSYVRSCLLA